MLKTLFTALEALGSALPITLGALGFVAYKIGPQMIGPLMLAMFWGNWWGNWGLGKLGEIGVRVKLS